MDLEIEFHRLGNACKWKIYYFISFPAPSLMLDVFFFKNILQTWGLPAFRGFFGLIFPTKQTLSQQFCYWKKQRNFDLFWQYSTLVHHLQMKRSSLLTVYPKYKFQISLLSSYVFFKLFQLNQQCVLSLDMWTISKGCLPWKNNRYVRWRNGMDNIWEHARANFSRIDIT